MNRHGAFTSESRPIMRACRCKRSTAFHHGTTIVECVIASTLLAAALMTLGLVHNRIARGTNEVRKMDVVRTALLNARAEIGSWPASEISVDRIRQLSVPAQLQEMATSIQWSANIDEGPTTENNVDARRVTLMLQWTDRGGSNTVRQQSLTFWMQP